MNEEKARRLAWPIAWISIALVVIALILSVIALTAAGEVLEPALHQIFSPIFAISYILIGGLVASRRPRNPVGWISAAVGFFFSLGLVSLAYDMLSSSLIAEGSLPGADFALWVEQWAWFPPSVLPMTFLLLLYPDGRLPSRRWRPIAWASAAGLIAAVFIMALIAGLNPGQRLETESFEAAVGEGMLNLLTITVAPLLVIGVVGSVTAPIVRFRRSRGIERQQMKWMAYAGAILILGVLLGSVLTQTLPNSQLASELGIILTNATQLGIVLAAAVAILKYRLYDIDILINRTLVYGVLTVITMGIYVLAVGYLGNLFQARDKSVIAFMTTGLVALLFQPLRDRLQRIVNRFMYGERSDPVSVLTKLGKQLEETVSPHDALSGMVVMIAQTLKLPYVAIEFGVGKEASVLASYGQPSEDLIQFPIIYQAQIIGCLDVAPRSLGEPFSDKDNVLLENIARQAGSAAQAARLTTDLQRSRQRLVTAREEERRRLRRDLHDGIGPTMAGQTLILDAAIDLILGDPESGQEQDLEEAINLLSGLKEQTQHTVKNIRHIVYALRPPSLDDLGLVAAIQAHVDQLVLSKQGLSISIENSLQDIPRFSAAVELAAYRIVLEALTNVINHAQAQECHVVIMVSGADESRTLKLEINDDGIGFPEKNRPGIGLASMRERAEELGGSFSIIHDNNRGARVLANIPLDAMDR